MKDCIVNDMHEEEMEIYKPFHNIIYIIVYTYTHQVNMYTSTRVNVIRHMRWVDGTGGILL